MGVKPLRIRFDQVYGSLKFMMKLEMNVDIKNYLIVGFITNFMIRLIILQVKKVIINKVLITILKESDLIHIVLYLQKKILTFQNVTILIKSVVDKNKNNYYFNAFLEKGLYVDKPNT